ncbi:hypothetical protein EV138_1219 [Kribbella voronezhensis]|uniref:Uncharacterized protein n=1 Tax=Kribbella voronezhensis TaxID=2512212 RepID=A0A4R7T705_9ACTN|nr:hypothetical protein [Kribbella voronezhensis]TDU87692.1 hypothetical protein EV138_1219 [Kribbella voronezhensis]
MTHLDHRKPPTRAARSKHSASSPSSDAASRKTTGRSAGDGTGRQTTDRSLGDGTGRQTTDRSLGDGTGRRKTSNSHSAGSPSSDGTRRRKASRSHSAIGAAVVGGAAMVAAFAFILTNGNSHTTDDSIRTGSLPQATSTVAQPRTNSAPTLASGKADRKPPVGKTTTSKTTAGKTSATPNTGSESPTFRRGQWIAVVDSVQADAGVAADQLAKGLAAKLIAAGVPAKALLASGQYPGLANSSFEPIRGTWIVYIGPVSSADAANTLCVSPKTQKAVGAIPACPTYEPATVHN